MTSASATPTFIGSPSGSPVIAIQPHSAWVNEVVAWSAAVLTEPGDRAPHQLAIATHDLRGIEAASLERAAPEVVDDDVGVALRVD